MGESTHMTIKDIAKESGYAVGTVSRVLNNHPNVSDEARRKILDTVKAYGFKLNSNAKQLRQSSSSDIAVLVKGTSNTLFSLIVEHIQSLSREAGFTTSVFYIDEEENEISEATKISREIKPPAIMFLGGNARSFEKRIENIDIPCVVVTTDISEVNAENISSVGINDLEAAKSAIDHLFQNGHTKIGVIGGNPEESDTCRKRLDGCLESFAAHGRGFNISKQYQYARFAYGSAYRGMLRLLEKFPDLTAVFAMSDTMAIGTISALSDSGYNVPQDISVIGFDGIPIGEFYRPKLTTIRQPVAAIAERSVRIIIEGIKGNTNPIYEFLPFEMVEGESVRHIF